MKILKLLLIIALLSGCTWSQRQRDIAASVGRATLSLTQIAADITLRVIYAKYVGGNATTGANWLDSVAGGLRSLETQSNGVVTGDMVSETLRSFTDPNKVHWANFADGIADAFANSPLPTNEKLETLATQANIQAATLRVSQ